jgi:hypothetical protein
MSSSLWEVQAAEVLLNLEAHRASGLPVSDRLIAEVQRPGQIFVMMLTRVEEFFQLVWQSSRETTPLAPPRHPRTLHNCASRLSQFGWEFDRLVEHGHSWFSTCAGIDKAFDYSKFGFIAVTPLTSSERHETPEGSYYIYDGVHRSIVLAKKLLREEIAYSPVQTILLEPRRN